METKKDRTVRILKENNILRCPVCKENFDLNDDYTVSCTNNHSFDISKKGVINLAGSSNHKIYNDVLFKNRRKVISNGGYAPLIDTLSDIIHTYGSKTKPSLSILDAGCGEGSFLSLINNNLNRKSIPNNKLLVGIDLSRQGVNLATDYSDDILWIIDDIAKLNLMNDSLNIILNILSPANYLEFSRVLKEDGIVIKVIPGKSYLKELREFLPLKEYDNKETLNHAIKEMVLLEQVNVNYNMSLSDADLASFMQMTPLTYGKLELMNNKEVHDLTIDLEILVANINK
jgi:23S rRNA (guanine745-N1)-methyltransferase